MLRVSALIVTYQHERYVSEAIESALGQTRPPDEVVVVDDGSSDRTLEVVGELADPRVRVIALPHRGIEMLAQTYDRGVEACTGHVVALLEGDDRWPRDKLERQLPLFADPNVVLAHGRYAVIGANGGLLHAGVAPGLPIPAGTYDARPFLLRASYIMSVTAVLRRSALLAAGGFRQLRATPHWDHPTFLALSEQGNFAYTASVVGEWRRHARSATFRLAGADLAGIEISRRLALDARERMEGDGLPGRTEIERAWDDAHAQMMWQSARILLLAGRHAEARALAAAALRRRASPSLRARLLLAVAASVLRVPLEPIARMVAGRSVFRELD